MLAGLQAEQGDEDRALATLREAWRRFPGHRGAQAALTQALARSGDQVHAVVTAKAADLLRNHPALSGVTAYDKRGRDAGGEGNQCALSRKGYEARGRSAEFRHCRNHRPRNEVREAGGGVA